MEKHLVGLLMYHWSVLAFMDKPPSWLLSKDTYLVGLLIHHGSGLTSWTKPSVGCFPRIHLWLAFSFIMGQSRTRIMDKTISWLLYKDTSLIGLLIHHGSGLTSWTKPSVGCFPRIHLWLAFSFIMGQDSHHGQNHQLVVFQGYIFGWPSHSSWV